MLGPQEPPDIQKVSSPYLFSFSVHRFSTIDDKMPNFSILTTLVKSTIKYNRGCSTHAREIVQCSDIFRARMLIFGMDRLHPYNQEKSPKEISVGSTVNGLQPVYGGLGAQRLPPPPLIGLRFGILSLKIIPYDSALQVDQQISLDCRSIIKPKTIIFANASSSDRYEILVLHLYFYKTR